MSATRRIYFARSIHFYYFSVTEAGITNIGGVYHGCFQDSWRWEPKNLKIMITFTNNRDTS